MRARSMGLPSWRRADSTDATERSGARLAVGAVLVGAAAVTAVMTTGEGGDGVTALVVTRAVAEGAALGSGDVRAATVQVPEPGVLHGPSLAPGATAARSLSPGEPLLVRDVVASHPDDRRVTIPVSPEALPSGLGVGEHVDLWQPGRPSAPLIADVVVAGVTPPDIGAASVEVLVGPADVATAVAATTTSDIVLARRP